MSNDRIYFMRETFSLIDHLIKGQNWYDFGCGFGLSSETLYEFGAREVLSYEPDVRRVEQCSSKLTVTDKDTTEGFDNVIAYGVIEHVYVEQRQGLLQSLWRRLRPGGYMVIADTPNRLIPYDMHTTHLPIIPWLPEKVAQFVAEHSGKRWNWGEWRSCGWRGMWAGDFRKLTGKECHSPITKPRHKVLSSIGLHPHLIDPWPVWVWRKA